MGDKMYFDAQREVFLPLSDSSVSFREIDYTLRKHGEPVEDYYDVIVTYPSLDPLDSDASGLTFRALLSFVSFLQQNEGQTKDLKSIRNKLASTRSDMKATRVELDSIKSAIAKSRRSLRVEQNNLKLIASRLELMKNAIESLKTEWVKRGGKADDMDLKWFLSSRGQAPHVEAKHWEWTEERVGGEVARMREHCRELRKEMDHSEWELRVLKRNMKPDRDKELTLAMTLCGQEEIVKVLEAQERKLSRQNEASKAEADSGIPKGPGRPFRVPLQRNCTGAPQQFEVAGEVNGKPVNSNADSGSSYNVISQELASSLGLSPAPGTERSIRLPSGKHVRTLGNVDVKFKFPDKSAIYPLPCVVLSTCNQSLVLGSKFLKDTLTLTKYFTRRVKRVISGVLTRHTLKLLGEEHEMVPGHLNGHHTLILPDTGSGINAMSGNMARRLKLNVLTGKRYKSTVQYIDGSEARTDGMVRNVKLQISPNDKPRICKFHIIEGLPVDAILSNAMVEHLGIFSSYKHLLTTSDTLEDATGIYGITLIERCKAELRRLESEYYADISSAHPFSPATIERERARRDLIRDRIGQLPTDERQEEQEKEDKRKKEWDDLWRNYRENVHLISQSPNSSSDPSSASSIQTPSSQAAPSPANDSSNPDNNTNQPDLEQGDGSTPVPTHRFSLGAWMARERRRFGR